MRLNDWRLIAGALLLLTVLGFIFLRGPTPEIHLAAEDLTSVGPIGITNTMVTSWITVALIIIGVLLVTRSWTLIPNKAQNLVEAALEAFYNIVRNVAGEENARRFFPVVGTIFFFILISNWLSLFPMFHVMGFTSEEDHGFVMEQVSAGPFDISFTTFSFIPGGNWSGEVIDEDDPDHVARAEEARAEGKFVGEIIAVFRGANTDVNTPLALAVVAVIIVQFWGISSLGLFGYGRKFFNFGNFFKGVFTFSPGLLFTGMIDAFVGLLELVSELVRLISFTFRLFGNMFAGEVVILMFVFLTPLVFTLPFYGLELFVGLIQAFIFAMLTTVFGVMAVSHGEAHAADERHSPDYGKEPLEEGLADVKEPSA